MRVLIWLGCILVYSIIVTALRGAGIILGGIPTAVLALVVVFLPAPALCKLWSRRKEKKVAEPPEKWYTCQRCGQLVREGDECDCLEAEERQKAEELGMTVERYRAFREDIESNIAEKHFRDATKKMERRFPWGLIGYVLLIVWIFAFVIMSFWSDEKDPYPSCGEEARLTFSCSCCGAMLCENCSSNADDFLAEEKKSEYSSGFEDGANAGYEDGLHDGYKDGYDDGMVDGYAEGCYDSIYG